MPDVRVLALLNHLVNRNRRLSESSMAEVSVQSVVGYPGF